MQIWLIKYMKRCLSLLVGIFATFSFQSVFSVEFKIDVQSEMKIPSGEIFGMSNVEGSQKVRGILVFEREYFQKDKPDLVVWFKPSQSELLKLPYLSNGNSIVNRPEQVVVWHNSLFIEKYLGNIEIKDILENGMQITANVFVNVSEFGAAVDCDRWFFFTQIHEVVNFERRTGAPVKIEKSSC